MTLSGGRRRTLLLAVLGLAALALAGGSLAASLVIHPSAQAGAAKHRTVTIDPNNLAAGAVEMELDNRAGARYDFYLTVQERDNQAGDYCQFDVNAYRGANTRYLTYAYVYFGDDVVRKRHQGTTTFETYELDRNVHISSSTERVRLTFTPTSAWFTGMQSIQGRIDAVEITPMDRLLLLGTSVLQVTTFPVAFLGVALFWLAVMRQLRLIGVRVSPPPAREYRAPPGRALRRTEAARTDGGSP